MQYDTGSIAAVPEVQVEEISASDGRKLLAPRVRDRLGVSIDEFLRRLDAGEYDDTKDDSVLQLVMLAPLAR